MSRQQPTSHRTADDEVVVYPSRRKVVLWTVAALAFVVVVVALLWIAAPLSSNPLAAVLAASAVLAMCVVLCILALLRTWSSAPVLIINHDGLSVGPWWLGSGLIRWSEIAGLRAYRAGLQTRLRIEVTDARTISARQRKLQRLVYHILKGDLARSGAVVTADGLWRVSVQELVRLIRHHFRDELAHYGIYVRTD